MAVPYLCLNDKVSTTYRLLQTKPKTIRQVLPCKNEQFQANIKLVELTTFL
jgi:hypothetical protein